MAPNIERLVQMLRGLDPSEWTVALNAVLTSPDVIEIGGYPRSDRASFILDRARRRRGNAARLGLRTFGLDNLITVLETVPPDTTLENYGVNNSAYTGSCFVLKGKLLGCEFVEKGLAKSIPYRG